MSQKTLCDQNPTVFDFIHSVIHGPLIHALHRRMCRTIRLPLTSDIIPLNASLFAMDLSKLFELELSHYLDSFVRASVLGWTSIRSRTKHLRMGTRSSISRTAAFSLLAEEATRMRFKSLISLHSQLVSIIRMELRNHGKVAALVFANGEAEVKISSLCS